MKPLPAPPCRISRRSLLGLGTGLVLAPWVALGQSVDPAPAGTGSEIHDLDWIDGARDRAVPVRLYLPETGPAAPLMVFSHGLGGSRLGYGYLGRYMAEHGVASLHLQHVGSDRSLWSGNPLNLIARLQRAAHEDEAQARARDLRFGIDRLLSDGRWAERLDARQIVAAGHCYGANTAMLAAGARVLRGGQAIALQDERLRAILLLSSPPFYGEPDLAAVLGPVRLPSLHLSCTEDVINIPGYASPASDRIAVYQAIGSPRKALAVFEGGSHSIFTDRLSPGGPELNQQVMAATLEAMLAFIQGLDSRLAPLGPLPELLRWRQRHAAFIARFELST